LSRARAYNNRGISESGFQVKTPRTISKFIPEGGFHQVIYKNIEGEKLIPPGKRFLSAGASKPEFLEIGYYYLCLLEKLLFAF